MLGMKRKKRQRMLRLWVPRITTASGYWFRGFNRQATRFTLEKRRGFLGLPFVRFGLASLALLAGLLASCAPTGTTGMSSQEVLATAQSITEAYQTATAEATATETATQTETAEPRVTPLAMEEMFTEKAVKVWEARGDGGYFSGEDYPTGWDRSMASGPDPIPELEKPEQYIYLDFSHEGQIRIVESSALDEHSWGLFYIREREIESGGVIPITMVTWAIYEQLFKYGREAEVVWGDLKPGTVFFVSDEALYQYSTPQMSEEDFKKLFLPIEDPRFTCTEVDTVYDRKGNLKQNLGTICEYTG